MTSAPPSYPFGASIEPDADLKKRLLDNLNQRFSKPRLDIHVSDLVYCLRASVFKKLNPKPSRPQELIYFTAGRGHHDILEGLHGAEREVKRERDGVKATYDLLEEFVVELKTTRSVRHEIKRHFVKQLAFYCVIEGKDRGKLLIMYLAPQFRQKQAAKDDVEDLDTFRVIFPDMNSVRQEFEANRNFVVKAVDAKDPSLAPPVIGTEDEWQCPNCRYLQECGDLQRARGLRPPPATKRYGGQPRP